MIFPLQCSNLCPYQRNTRGFSSMAEVLRERIYCAGDSSCRGSYLHLLDPDLVREGWRMCLNPFSNRKQPRKISPSERLRVSALEMTWYVAESIIEGF